MATEINGIVGPQVRADGSAFSLRGDKQGAAVVTDAHGRYHEAALRQKLFTAYLAQGTSTVAAGNIVAAAAAASTQFAVWNPLTSGIVMVLQKLIIKQYSGTPTVGGLSHSTFNASGVSISTTAGAVRNNYSGGAVGGGLCVASAGGTALTGGLGLSILRDAALSSYAASALASTAGYTGLFEEMAGDIVIPPGQGYVPTWTGAGTTHLVGYSLTWEEIAV